MINNYRKNILISLFMIINITLLIGLNLTNYIQNYKEWILYASILIVIHFIVNIGFIGYFLKSLFNLTIFFVVFTYLFHFGEIVLLGLFPNYIFEVSPFSQMYSMAIQYKSISFSLMIVTMVTLGILISNRFYKLQVNNNFGSKKSIIYSKYMGIISLVFTFPIQLYIDFNKLITSISSGYWGVIYSEISINGILNTLASFYIIGVGLLIIGYKNNKYIARFIVLFFLTYNILMMFGGSRGRYIINMILIIYIYYEFVEKLTFKNFVQLTVFSLLSIVFINTIKAVRSGGLSMEIVIQELGYQIYNNPIFKIMEEFGSTIYTVLIGFDKVGNSIDYGKGSTYILSVFNIFPNIGGILDNIIKSSSYGLNLGVPYIGGSFIGELYYNFGYFSIIVAPLIGYLVNYVSFKFKQISFSGDYVKVAYYIVPFISILWWVRDYFNGIVRSTVWSIAIYYTLYKIIKRLKIKKY